MNTYKQVSSGTTTVRYHRIVVESALGKSIPKKAVVHHIDYDKGNNSNNNLVLCQNQSYHNLIHRRTDALNATGNPNFRKCYLCQEWDDPTNLKTYNTTKPRHRSCANEASRKYYYANRSRSK